MIALKRVLVPTDFSEASAAAVKYGVALARAFNAKLDLLHVVVRHDLDVSVERQRVVDSLLAEMTAGAAPIGLDESMQRWALGTGEMAAVLDANPFADAAPNRVMVIFLDQPPPPDALHQASGLAGEQFVLGRREIYVHYPDGMGDSKLKIPGAKAGTARNLNTVAKLVGMVAN